MCVVPLSVKICSQVNKIVKAIQTDCNFCKFSLLFVNHYDSEFIKQHHLDYEGNLFATALLRNARFSYSCF